MQKKFLVSASLFFGISLLVFFQNCSELDIQLLGGSQNNGGAYGGMTSKTYAQFVPDFTCENQISAKNVITILNSQVTWKQHKFLQCNWSETVINASEIDNSKYQSEIIGYGPGIYEGVSSLEGKIPANLVEIWCHIPNNPIEIISHYDTSNQAAVSRVYYTTKTGIAGLLTDFPVARILNQNQIQVRDGKDFDLIVYRNQPATIAGLFKAKLKVKIEGELLEQETSCRIGASLDPSIWPVKTIVDVPLNQFKISSDLNRIAYSTKDTKNLERLYTGSSDGKEQQAITFNLNNGANTTFLFGNDNMSLLYTSNPDASYLYEVKRWDDSSKKSVNVDSSNNSYLGSANGLIYDEGSSELYFSSARKPTTPGVSHQWKLGDMLLAMPTDGRQARTVWAPSEQMLLGNSSSVNIYNYKISVAKQRAVILYSFLPWAKLFSADLIKDNSNIDLTPNNVSVPGTNEKCPGICLPQFTPLSLSPQADYVAFNVQVKKDVTYGAVSRYSTCSDVSGGCVGTGIVSVDGAWKLEVGTNMTWLAFSKSGDEIILRDTFPSVSFPQTQYIQGRFYNTAGSVDEMLGFPEAKALYLMKQVRGPSPVMYQLPLLKEPFFANDKKSLVGIDSSSTGAKVIALDIETLATRDLCKQAVSSSVKIFEVNQDQYIIAAFQKTTGILSVYKYNSETSQCRLVNKALTTYAVDIIKNIILSPDQSKIVVTMERSLENYGAFHELIFVPIEGQGIPVTINSPTHEAATVSMVSFLKNSNGIIYFGNQVIPYQKQVFYWH